MILIRDLRGDRRTTAGYLHFWTLALDIRLGLGGSVGRGRVRAPYPWQSAQTSAPVFSPGLPPPFLPFYSVPIASHFVPTNRL